MPGSPRVTLPDRREHSGEMENRPDPMVFYDPVECTGLGNVQLFVMPCVSFRRIRSAARCDHPIVTVTATQFLRKLGSDLPQRAGDEDFLHVACSLRGPGSEHR